MTVIYVFIACAFAFRFTMLGISIRHERALRAGGAIEAGAATSRWLAVAHVSFYVSASVEGVLRARALDLIAAIGAGLYLAAAAMLVWIVIILGRLWTVKVLIAPDHVLSKHQLFRWFRHPNYFLNIVPELVALGLITHAYYTLIFGLPPYLVLLICRVREEEEAMHGAFPLHYMNPQ